MQHPRPLFKRNISVAGWMPLSSLLKQLKLTTASNTGVYAKVAILDEYLVDHWMLTHDHHLNDRLRLSHASRRCRRQRRGLRVGAINYCMSIRESKYTEAQWTTACPFVNRTDTHEWTVTQVTESTSKTSCPKNMFALYRETSEDITTRGVAINLLRGTKQSVWGTEAPAGSRGRVPVGVWGRRPQKLETYWMHNGFLTEKISKNIQHKEN